MAAFGLVSSDRIWERSHFVIPVIFQHASLILFSLVYFITIGNAGVGAVPLHNDGDIRLEGGTTAFEGRVEVYFQGSWGTVCDDYWDLNDAAVVCNQVWPGYSGLHFVSAYFGQGVGAILLDDVHCSGAERRLTDCNHGGLTSHNCYHGEDAGVRCYKPGVDGGAVRLVGGGQPYQGRVEIYQGTQWGTVCDDYWDLQDAAVVCRQLGFSGASDAPTRAYFGEGSGAIFLDDLECTGLEPRLVDCRGADFYRHNCRHYEDASVICIQPMYGDVRLANGTSYQGRLEIYQQGEWMSICSSDWTSDDSTVTCRQLGFTRAVNEVTSDFGNATSQFWGAEFSCEGDETLLSHCEANRNDACSSGQAAVVSCHVPDDGDLRLQGGAMFHEGRVEVYYQGSWGTICGDSWNQEDAAVACRQLGFPGAVAALRLAYFGQGQGSIHLDELQCLGSESRLADCYHRPWSLHDCSHYEDASVVCEHYEVGNIRLVDGGHAHEGRVEIWIDERGWMTLCDEGWDGNEGEVVCRQLGYEGLVRVELDGFFGEGTDHIFATDLGCTGEEDTLHSCDRDEHTTHCTHSHDAGVVCALPDGETRLVDGSESNGRVEIFHDNRWWTVCGHWYDTEATVLCHELGFTGVALSMHSFGPGSGDIVQDIQCSVYDATLRDCSVGSDFQNPVGCSHDDDVGVVCDDTKFEIGAVRLVNGYVSYAGRVEIFNGERWGSVCDVAWDIEDAHVVCRQVGYKRASFAEKGAFFGRNSYRVVSVGHNCRGTELTLHECPLAHGTLISDCTHDNDSSVICDSEMYDDLSVELVGNATYHSSRVSIFHDGQWKSACSDNWDWRAAQVTCLQAGFAGTSHTVDENAFIDFRPMVFTAHDIECAGYEYHLSECLSSWSSRTCTSNKVASVRCATSYHDVLHDGDIRLHNGTSSKDGLVEMFHGGHWRPTCGDDWGWEEAGVACRELGYLGAITSHRTMAIGDETEFILSGLSCEGYEYRLHDCTIPSIGWELTSACQHVGGAVCALTQELLHENGDIQLLPDVDSDHGTVAIFYRGVWGKVCPHDWSWPIANAVCVQLGYFGAIEATKNLADMDNELDYHIRSPNCDAYDHLRNCDLDAMWEDDVECNSDDDLAAGVLCTHEYQDLPFHGKARLVEGPDTGHVEVFLTDTWGLVCGDSWSYDEARVVCIQRGYRGVRTALSLPMDESLSRDIVMSDVECTGWEYFLTDCPSYSMDSYTHCQTMAYAECSTESDELSMQDGITIRLSGGYSAREGRVEVFIMGRWASLCDDMWTYEDASVVCRHLGYADGIVDHDAMWGGSYGSSSIGMVRGYPVCGGWEWSLNECILQNPYQECWNHDVGVNCDAYDPGLMIAIIIIVIVVVLLLIIIITCICCCCFCKKKPNPTVTPGAISMAPPPYLPPVMTDGGPKETAFIPNLQYATLPFMDDFMLPPGRAPLPPPVVYVPPP